ncbi:ATP synthase subunit I [Algoriphagus persicinus]|uniref:ATP synthase subunit I n=1 Tax=Algoriphagus persicinus TaxID=3108754 RepID=UPI002B37F6FC|nr:ATP synthase subunit I [Algoriphagus sp. E1-3-M2]MEB2787090.1 ATP synthase subunit I [Algoriphagus sp. E1-3-M2]
MNDMLYILFAFIAGLALGTLFFGGLWFTVKKAVHAKIPALWFIGGFVLRTGIVLTGFYFVAQGDWQKLIASLLGFVAARMIVLRITKRMDRKQMSFKKIDHEA